MSKQSYIIHVGGYAFDPLEPTPDLTDEFATAKRVPAESPYQIVRSATS